MRNKKSRHKLVALNFLSNISLDGRYEHKPDGISYHSSVPCVFSRGRGDVRNYRDNSDYEQQVNDTSNEIREKSAPITLSGLSERTLSSVTCAQNYALYNSLWTYVYRLIDLKHFLRLHFAYFDSFHY
uniref:Clone ZZD554 mRNA sequence n=1 Tax=Schistosoma japonicum TaxID=6182 RepID=Q86EC0_SCHJA|nr:hypothetical protein [Schistosoma japonicum]